MRPPSCLYARGPGLTKVDDTVSGLLPEENFTDNSTTHTLAADLRTAASQGDKKPEKGALKVKTIKRNYSFVHLVLNNIRVKRLTIFDSLSVRAGRRVTN